VATSYPWAGFGDTWRFHRDEQPIFGTDSLWTRAPSYSQARPLGSAIDSIVTLAIGSAVRSFECHLSPTRFNELEALVNTSNDFTDWKRPTPDSRAAFLLRLTPVDPDVRFVCHDGVTRQRIRTKVDLVSQ